MNSDLPLGRAVDYPRTFDPTLLFAIERAAARRALGLDPAALPFAGIDRWHAYELGWLDPRGKPQVATATFEVPADSSNLIESKSLKLYLNSLNATSFEDAETLRARIAADLTRAAGADVTVAFGVPSPGGDDHGESLDALDIAIDRYGPPDPGLISADPDTEARESLATALFKSNCPVTGQPDWARVLIDYRGPRLDRAGLLRYLVSFRDHAGFHEQCVERIFSDLIDRARPTALSVEARYTRRGGLDINPWRATPGWPRPPAARDARQ